jgi:hypothetical protein
MPPDRRALTIGAFPGYPDFCLAGAGPFVGAIAEVHQVSMTFIALPF